VSLAIYLTLKKKLQMVYNIKRLHRSVTEGIQYIVQNHMIKFMLFNALFTPTEVAVVHTLNLENWFFLTPWVTGFFLVFLVLVRVLDFIVTNPIVAVRLLVLLLIIYCIKFGMMNTTFCSDELAVRKVLLDKQLDSGLLKKSMKFVKTCVLSESREAALHQVDTDTVKALYVGKFLSTTVPGASTIYADPSILSMAKIKALGRVLPGIFTFGVISYVGIDVIQSHFIQSVINHRNKLTDLENSREAMSVLVTYLKNGWDVDKIPRGLFEGITTGRYDKESVACILNVEVD